MALSKFISKIYTLSIKKSLKVRSLGGGISFYVKKIKNKRGTGRFTRSIINCLNHLTSGFNEKIPFFSAVTSIDVASTLIKDGCVTIHDNIPSLLYKKFSKKKTNQWVYKYRNVLKTSGTLVSSISKSSSLIVANYYSLPINKIKVLFNGNTKFFNNSKIKTLFLIKNYYFFLGTLDFNKNTALIIKTIRVFFKLKYGYSVTIGSGFINKRLNIFNLGYTSDYFLKKVIGGAGVNLFLSLYEGFGLPPVESGFINKKSITSSRPSMLEINGKLQLYIDPLSIYELKNSLYFFRKKTNKHFKKYYSFFL
jgi:hypothetical protein